MMIPFYEWNFLVGCILVQALLVSDFGPKISIKIVDSLRSDILAGKLKSGNEIKVFLSLFFFLLSSSAQL